MTEGGHSVAGSILAPKMYLTDESRSSVRGMNNAAFSHRCVVVDLLNAGGLPSLLVLMANACCARLVCGNFNHTSIVFERKRNARHGHKQQRL